MWAFHFAPGIQVQDAGDSEAGMFELVLPSGSLCHLSNRPGRGRSELERGWVAPAYGDRRMEAPILLRRTWTAFPIDPRFG